MRIRHSAENIANLNQSAQLSLIGYDNTYLAGIRRLSLTSVVPVSRDVGVRGARLLLERIADPSLQQRTEVLPLRLVVRNCPARPCRADAPSRSCPAGLAAIHPALPPCPCDTHHGKLLTNLYNYFHT
ncbi:substrate-binding domain-containing protein [Arthrobacter pascens]|uniref:substrate-binding domain-containing protein n=1 Tax=Arthrobacter pascens TaxID=1677 RepID=UPI00286B7E5F|nr:substrate-binding domain-containing protein [Arthrobacter pascens]